MLGFSPIGAIPLGALPTKKSGVVYVVGTSSGNSLAIAEVVYVPIPVLVGGSSYAMAVSYIFWHGTEVIQVQCEPRAVLVEKECVTLRVPPKQGCC